MLPTAAILTSVFFIGGLLSAVEAVPAVVPPNAAVTAWMSWEGGVDIVGMTKPGLTQPNLILHVARSVHTPVGTAASGLVVWQPDPAAAPTVFGMVSENPGVGAYFGPHVFAGTPFEKAPVLLAKISVETLADKATSRIEVAGHIFTVTLTGLAPIQIVDRPAGHMPFRQLGLESAAKTVAVTIDGKSVDVTIPPTTAATGPAAVYSQTGLYAR